MDLTCQELIDVLQNANNDFAWVSWEDGDLPADVDPADLACFVVTLIRGMAAQAAGGASREELRRVVEMAWRARPE